MKLLLILTPARPGEKRKYTCPPIGLLYLGSYVKNLNHEVIILDADVAGYTLDELATNIANKNADLIGFTAMTPFAGNVLNLCKKIKSIKPKSKICIGGVHVTATGKEMMEESRYVDFLVIGEGEITLAELMGALENKANFADIKGLVYRDQTTGEIIQNEFRPPIQDLDNLPIPDLGLIENLDIDNYRSVHAHNKRVIYISGSRGCPFSCTFCAAHLVHGREVRFRNPKKIVDEIEYNQKKYSIGYVGFKDGTFTLNHQWVKELCSEIINRKIKIGFAVNARVDTINEDILMVLKKAGCQTIGFGLESGSQRILDIMRKGTSLKQITEAIGLVRRYDFFSVGSYMIGNPGDTRESINETYKLARDLKTTAVAFSPLTAFPGTQIYFDALKNGSLKNPKWYLKKDPNNNDEFLPTTNYDGVLTFSEFNTEKELNKTYHKYYFRIPYIFSMIKRVIREPYLLKYAIGYTWGIIKKTFVDT